MMMLQNFGKSPPNSSFNTVGKLRKYDPILYNVYLESNGERFGVSSSSKPTCSSSKSAKESKIWSKGISYSNGSRAKPPKMGLYLA
jgi:hypothetical protein